MFCFILTHNINPLYSFINYSIPAMHPHSNPNPSNKSHIPINLNPSKKSEAESKWKVSGKSIPLKSL